jgi:hypothetical protein
MERPLIQNFMPEGTTLATAHRKYMDAPELYAYMTALDAYADHLEDENRKLEIAEKFKISSDPFMPLKGLPGLLEISEDQVIKNDLLDDKKEYEDCTCQTCRQLTK